MGIRHYIETGAVPHDVTTESAAKESQQPQQAPQGASQPPRTIADALVELCSSFADTWVRPLENPLPKQRRRLFAFTGSLPWLIVNLKSDWSTDLAIFDGSGIGLGPLIVITVFAQILLALWFAFLISYQDRRCSPTRFFIEGLIFPGVAATLISGSALTNLFGLGGQP